uniref:Uncharacterized protein n=1 Tax=Pectinophora gossypiella TaxID=13191 RepID=A0A1E1WMT8_PECGO
MHHIDFIFTRVSNRFVGYICHNNTGQKKVDAFWRAVITKKLNNFQRTKEGALEQRTEISEHSDYSETDQSRNNSVFSDITINNSFIRLPVDAQEEYSVKSYHHHQPYDAHCWA